MILHNRGEEPQRKQKARERVRGCLHAKHAGALSACGAPKAKAGAAEHPTAFLSCEASCARLERPEKNYETLFFADFFDFKP